MTDAEIEEYKKKIDAMTRTEMCRAWRFHKIGSVYFNSELPLYDYFKARFDKLGGFSPTISKEIGW